MLVSLAFSFSFRSPPPESSLVSPTFTNSLECHSREATSGLRAGRQLSASRATSGFDVAMAGLRQLLFGDAPLRAMATLGLKYGAGDLIAQQATNPGGEINCARAGVFLAFGTYYGFVNYSVFRALAWSPVPAGLWPKALFSAFFDGCVHVPILLYPQHPRPAQTASRQRQRQG